MGSNAPCEIGSFSRRSIDPRLDAAGGREVLIQNLDPRYPVNLFHGYGQGLKLIAELPPLGKWEGEDSDLYWADSTLVDFGGET